MARSAGRREAREEEGRQNRAGAPPRARRDVRAPMPERRGERTGPRKKTADSRIAAFLLANPAAVGGGLALIVALSFVSANALWGQPYRHAGAFFSTRPAPLAPAGGTGNAAAKPVLVPAADPALQRVQSALKDAGIYTGSVDGLNGPGTRKAIAAFRAAHSLPASGEADADLIAKLIDGTSTASTAPARSAAPSQGDRQRTMKIQAGLKAFGNDGIEVDGVMGARTRNAIREFQGVWRMPQTGEADAALYAKMKEVGLTD